MKLLMGREETKDEWGEEGTASVKRPRVGFSPTCNYETMRGK